MSGFADARAPVFSRVHRTAQRHAGAGRNPDEVSREAVVLPGGAPDLLGEKALNYGVRDAG
ncbi:hypothetical protein [Streptomyces sp. LN704]|uniref:hypothetical protein n=1 Tax=unclassified Streptomyces TaxID=2593676 RepID=UPI0037155A8E